MWSVYPYTCLIWQNIPVFGNWYDHLRIFSFYAICIMLCARLLITIFGGAIYEGVLPEESNKCMSLHRRGCCFYIKTSNNCKRRCFPLIMFTSRSSLSFLWYKIPGCQYSYWPVMPNYMTTFLQWNIIDPHPMSLIFDLIFISGIPLAIKLGEFIRIKLHLKAQLPWSINYSNCNSFSISNKVSIACNEVTSMFICER